MPDGAWGADGHVIVCGLHGVGLRTVEQLHQSRVPVVVVDDAPDPRLAQIVEGWGLTLIRRSARIGDGLAGAGLDRAQAVICVESDELATLEIAMRVREARPDVRLVVLMANPSVGRALERVLGSGVILDPAALAAPRSSRSVCCGPPTRSNSGGERFAVAEVDVVEDEAAGRTFRSRFGHLAPVAVVPADGSGHRLLPGPRPPGRGGGPRGRAGHAGRTRPVRHRPRRAAGPDRRLRCPSPSACGAGSPHSATRTPGA